MKRRNCYLAIFLIMGLLLSACSTKSRRDEALTPTGYPSEEVQRITVYYNGALYWYMGNGFDQPLERGFEKAGEVSKVDNQEYPKEEFCGTRLDVGQEIYASSEELSRIYVKYDNGYAVFEKQGMETATEESTETEDSSNITSEDEDVLLFKVMDRIIGESVRKMVYG